MENNNFGLKQYSSTKEFANREKFFDTFQKHPIPQNELLGNLDIFISRQSLTKTLYITDIYQKILNTHGIIIEFGVRWGRNLVTFTKLRGIFEPYNYNRKIVGFDTFEGFPSIHEKDGKENQNTTGAYSVTPNYKEYLEEILSYHESECPISHIKKFELVQGDASIEIKKYLSEHPETIVALAYFDFDLYEPTKKCLEAIQPYLAKGSIVAFDELNYALFPGETVALREVFGLSKYPIRRSPFSATQSYIVIE